MNEQNVVRIVRDFDAPRELIFKAWTDAEMMVKWWGPKDFTAKVAKLDLRVGGLCHSVMIDPDGNEHWSLSEYVEIDPPSKLVLSDSFANAEGEKIDPTVYGADESFPKESLITVTFEELEGNRTQMTMTHGIPIDVAEQIGAVVGWVQQFDKLDVLLADS